MNKNNNLRHRAAQKLFTFHFSLFALLSAGTAIGQDNFFPDGEHFSSMRGGNIVKIEYFTDKVTDTLFGVRGAASGHILSPDGQKALLVYGRTPIYRHSYTADYQIADFASGRVTPVSISAIPGMRDASFSPDGSRVAFVRQNNLFVTDPGSTQETRITQDGESRNIINGAADWVYEEEYGFTKAYEWSPDSKEIAFLRFDESRVEEFTMMRYDERLYPSPYRFKYPKAGEENSIVTLHVYNIDTQETRTIETGPETDQYIPHIGWTPSGELFFYRVNRLQNHFEVLLADRNGKTRPIYDETSPRYVERPDETTVTFLPDGDRFIVWNETRTGWGHLYLYSIKKGFLNAITSGEWEVTELLGEKDGTVWYMSTEPSPLERQMYSVKLNGKSKTRITKEEGFYSVATTPGMKYFRENLRQAPSTVISTIKRLDNPAIVSDIQTVSVATNDARGFFRFFTFTTEDGIELNGWMMGPVGFDESKKYPVFMTQYSGPGSQSANHGSRPDGHIFDPLLNAGYIIACVDGRGTGYRGEEFKKCTYGQLGKLEAEDQIAAARYLSSLPYVDSLRIGIYGWSFGGFTSLNCILKGRHYFKLAVAVAPVTNWRYYDTIYTEIYNGLPEENPEGYDDNSPINFAENLQGKLLLIHGTGDDNVHVQNSYEMAKALIKAGRQFDMMIYPDDNHSMWPNGGRHIRQKIADYVITNL